MKKINIENEQEVVSWLLEALENENKRSARQILNTMKSSAYSKQYRLEKAIKEQKYSGAELEVAKSELLKAKNTYEDVKSAVDVVRHYLEDPQHIRINKAINRLNIAEAKREAEIKLKVKEQRSIISIKADEKMQILVQRLIYENKLYDLDEATIDRLQKTFEKIGINLKQSIFSIFNKAKHFDSGDEFQPLMEIYEHSIIALQGKQNLTDEEREEIINAIEIYKEGIS